MTAVIQQGNASAANAYMAIVRDFGPRLVILIDIGGSISEDLGLCDVVIATQVIYYENRKEVPGKTNRRGEVYKLHAKLRALLNKYFIHHGEPAIFRAEDSNSHQESLKVLPGPIGCGEAVVADAASEIKSWLLSVNSKTLALEMEAGGFMQAFYEDQLGDDHPELGALVIRGISDHADVAKDDKWRQPAARNALTALIEFLKLIPASLK